MVGLGSMHPHVISCKTPFEGGSRGGLHSDCILKQHLAVSLGPDCLMAAGYAFEELRPLMDKLPASDLATGGQAVALSQWHRVRFGHRSG